MKKITILSVASAFVVSLMLFVSGCENSGGGGPKYSDFNWTFGNNFGAAKEDGVKISNFKIGSEKMTYKYDVDLGAWGVYDCSARICMFVKDANGKWIGGMFDWISSDRTSRPLTHLGIGGTGYNGWTVNGNEFVAPVPNPTDAALVIVHDDGTRRSNIITAKWQR